MELDTTGFTHAYEVKRQLTTVQFLLMIGYSLHVVVLRQLEATRDVTRLAVPFTNLTVCSTTEHSAEIKIPGITKFLILHQNNLPKYYNF